MLLGELREGVWVSERLLDAWEGAIVLVYFHRFGVGRHD